MAQPADTLIYRYLDTNGDGSGEKNAIGDYRTAPTKFFIQTPEDLGALYLSRMIWAIEGSPGFRAERYGNRRALTNGITVKVIDADGLLISDLTDGLPVKTSAHIGRLCYDVDVKSWGRGDEMMLARFTFAKSGSELTLPPGASLQVELNDNFTRFTSHNFMVQGIESY